MDKKVNPSINCIDFEFIRSQSVSRQAKVQEFWKYLDSQDILKPYEVSKSVDGEDKNNDPGTRESSSSSSTEASPSPKTNGTKPKSKVVKEKKRANGETCNLEKYLREDLRYADSVEVTYDELNAEIEDYQRRLQQCGCKIKCCDCLKKKSR